MMKSFLLTLLISITSFLSAQHQISTKKTTSYTWDKVKKDWYIESSEETTTFFEFNEKGTIVKHTSSVTTTTYMIKSLEIDSSKGRVILYYALVSDTGNSCIMGVDGGRRKVSMIFPPPIGIMRIYRMKAIWQDD